MSTFDHFPYIKFFTLATVATLQHFLKISMLRVNKVFYPCNRCHLATLSENQYVTCDNEVTRVTTNDVFAHRFTQH